MKLKTRLVLMLVIMLLATLAAAGVLQYIHRAEEKEFFTYMRLEREGLCNQTIPLLELPLDQLTRDYSQWDEMVSFVAKPDPEWARVNIDSSLTTFHLAAVWVLTEQGQIAYATKEPKVKTMPAPPDANQAFLARLQRDPFLACYIRRGDAVYALRAAPVQPSADFKRTTPPAGWLIGLAQLDAEYIERLGELNSTKAELLTTPNEPLASVNKTTSKISRDLRDPEGNAVATLRLDFNPSTLPHDSNFQEMLLLVAMATVLIFTTLLVLNFWVLRPFAQISQSLVTGDPDALKPLLGTRTEIGHIARLVRIHFANQRSLNEIMNARAQLARDLHDGVIQSIYAAGMGVAAAQAQIETNPAAAANQLLQIRALLNDTIRETRSYITGLDADTNDDQPFGAAVEALFESTSWIRKAASIIEINEAAAHNLPRPVREQALQMIREALTNSLRHGHAGEIRIQLRNTEERTILTITDNGRGFDPARKSSGGRGLNNLAERASHIGAILKIDSAPGKGTCVSIRFASTKPIHA